MNMIECLGFDFLTEDEETFSNFVGAVCAEGKAIFGYYGYPYLNREFGWAQFIARIEVNEEKQQLEPGPWVHNPALLMTSSVTWACPMTSLCLSSLLTWDMETVRVPTLMGGKGRIE